MLRRVTTVLGATLFALLASCGGSTDGDPSGTGGAGALGGSGGSGASGGTGGGAAGTGGTSDGGVLPSWTSCSKPSECVLRPVSCCGSCGAATRSDAIALNQSGAAAYHTAQNCDATPCPACAQAQDPTLLATCEAGTCVVVDLLTHPSTACSTVADCRVRTNACCECGGPTDPDSLISVGSAGGFDALVCDPSTGCPECAPVYPQVPLACENGHCQVVD